MIDSSWRMHFAHESQRTQAWYQSNKPEGSVLFWAIKRGDLPFDAYLKWAQNHYELPFLADDFFDSVNEGSLLKEIAKEHQWSPELMPVAKWEGVIYVACIAPPTDFTTRGKSWCFLLASPEKLQQFWQRTTGGRSHTNSDAQDPFEQIANTSQQQPPGDFSQARSSRTKDLKSEISQGLLGAKNTSEAKDNKPSYLSQALAKSTPQIQQAFEQSSARLLKHFPKSMVWNLENDALSATFWSKDFNPKPEGIDQPIRLNEASIFRIVSRSHKAYHGYIIVNEINKQFIDIWNSGESPEHITLAPVIVNSQLTAMVMGIGTEKIPFKASLQLATSVAKQLASDIAHVLGLEAKKESA